MKRLDTHIGSFDSPLQEAPKVFDSAGVDVATEVLDGMVDNLMVIYGVKPSISASVVRVQGSASRHIFFHAAAKRYLHGIGDDFRFHVTATIAEAKNDYLALSARSNWIPCETRLVHVLGF